MLITRPWRYEVVLIAPMIALFALLLPGNTAAAAQATVNAANHPAFDPADATEALQAALDSDADRVIVPNVGEPWIVEPIELRSDQELTFERGVEIIAKEGAFRGRNDCLFTARDVKNLIIHGYGATWRMHKDDYQQEPYASSQWRHTLSILGSTNVKIEGLTLANSGGDGIYIAQSRSGGKNYSEDITIRDVISDGHHRQGMSVISVQSMLVERCIFSNTRGTAPMAGICLEPNQSTQRLVDIVIRRCQLEANEKLGLHVWLKNLAGSETPVSILFEDCQVIGPTDVGLHVGAVPDDGPEGEIIFRRCWVQNIRHNGIRLRDKSARSIRVAFENCVLTETGTESVTMWNEPVAGPITMYTIYEVTHDPGGVTFDQCLIIDDQNRPFMTALDGIGAAPDGFRDIRGRFQLISPHEPQARILTQTRDVNIQVNRSAP